MKAVVFDLDGVVVDSEKYWSKLEECIYAEATGSENIDPQKLSGMSIKNTYQQLSGDYNLAVSFDEFFELYEEQAKEVYREKASLMPELKQLMAEIREKGLKIGLATGSYWPRYVIERFDLDFDAVVHSGMINGRGKPEPETYRMVVEKLEVEPSEAVAIDDTDAGAKSAKAAGLYCIGYGDTEGQGLSKADETIESHEELKNRLLKLVEAP